MSAEIKEIKKQVEQITDNRPWGFYTILQKGENYQVKHIVVEAKQRLSLQAHKHRDEHWVIVKGEGIVTLNEERIKLKENQRIFIPKLSKHRIENTQDSLLEFIEVQSGTYLEEDDIIRFEDDYGRN